MQPTPGVFSAIFLTQKRHPTLTQQRAIHIPEKYNLALIICYRISLTADAQMALF